MTVPGTGPVHAPVCIVGEAPGRDEAAQGVPFVGEAGKLLTTLLTTTGLAREDVRLENVVEERPPANKLDRLGLATVHRWVADLQRRLAGREHHVIVACGNLAFNAIRHGTAGVRVNKTGALVYRDTIMRWRGSILVVELGGRRVKCIPVLHPAFLLRAASYLQRTERDWQRIRQESTTARYRPPPRTHLVTPTLRDCRDYYRQLRTHPPPYLTHDVETPRTIGCIGYASTATESFTIPTLVTYWGDRAKTAQAWEIVRAIEALPIPTITQNGFYDHYWLQRQAGIPTRRWLWDLLPMHHTLDPLDEHALHHMASVLLHHYTYWKDEAKDPESVKKYAGNFHALCVYNGMDCVYQIACFEALRAQLRERPGALAVYIEHYRRLLNPLLRVMLHGWQIDERMRKRQFTRVVTQLYRTENALEALVGKPLHVKVGLSNKRIMDYLYGELGLRVPRGGRRNVDAVTLARLQAKYPRQLAVDAAGQGVVPLILQHRRHMMLKKSYTAAKVDADGRFRSTYNFAPKTGRLNSSANPMGTGDNGQNTDRDARAMYVADAGCVHVEFDLSQEEDRIVKALTRSPRLIALAHRPPWEGDSHRETAAIIFPETPEHAITHEQRQCGKFTRHATNYDMESNEFSNNLLKRGIVASPEQCQRWIDRLRAAEPEIPAWHKAVRTTLLYDRALTFACGFRVDYRYQRLSKKLYKEAYAIEPQHGCVCHLNQWGLVPLDRAIRRHRWQTRINAHVHDALHCSVPVAELADVLAVAYHALERTVVYHGIAIPKYVETKIGPSWGETWLEYKRRPTAAQLKRDTDELVGRLWDEQRG